MVIYIEYGDIFTLPEITNYAHGCNCAGAMGKGIALQFKNKFPKMYAEYKKRCNEGKFTLGDVFAYNYGNGTVFNLGTQANWKTKADINAIENALFKMLAYAFQNNILKIAMPKIGAGLGGLNWDDVKHTIDKAAKEYPHVDLLVVENYTDKDK
jgi:O-acetyl-ADP-ribose deacetylase (regulator of RNase III)